MEVVPLPTAVDGGVAAVAAEVPGGVVRFNPPLDATWGSGLSFHVGSRLHAVQRAISNLSKTRAVDKWVGWGGWGGGAKYLVDYDMEWSGSEGGGCWAFGGFGHGVRWAGIRWGGIRDSIQTLTGVACHHSTTLIVNPNDMRQ